MKECKKCGCVLEVGNNWTHTYKNNYDYRCLSCMREYNKDNYDSDKHKDYMKEYHQKPTSKLKKRDNHLKRAYGITLKEYNKMWKQQEGCCRICGDHELVLNKTLHVDHCHTSGKVRGLLCSNCNTGLGMFKDNQEILKNAVDYLKGEEWEWNEERTDIIGQNGNDGMHYVYNDDGTSVGVHHKMKKEYEPEFGKLRDGIKTP